MADLATRLTGLFGEIDKLIDQDDLEGVLSTVSSVLKLSEGDKDAVQVGCIAYIRLGQYTDALQWMEKYATVCLEMEGGMLYEKAYCLYRTNALDQALEMIPSLTYMDANVIAHLHAQILYRKGAYASSQRIYKDIADAEGAEVDDDELLTNRLAIEAVSETPTGLLDEINPIKFEDTYEIAFNAATCFLSSKNLDEAERLLSISLNLANDLFTDEGLTEEELNCELASIRIQVLYLNQLLQSTELDLVKEYEEILKLPLTDPSLSLVAANNLVVCRRDTDLFDSLKKLKYTANVLERLTTSQAQTLGLNRAILLNWMNKRQACHDTLDGLQAQFPDSDDPKCVLASLQLREGQLEACIQTLESALEQSKHPDRLLRTLAQVTLDQGDHEKAMGYLRKMDTERHTLEMLQTILQLTQDTTIAVELLDEAIAFWQSQSNEGELPAILRFSAAYKHQHGLFESAASDYELLLQLEGQNHETLAKLVITLAQFDAEKANVLGQRIPSLQGEDTLNANELEDAPAPKQSRWKKQLEKKEQAAVDMDVVVQKKKRKSRKRLPKDFDPENPGTPDPERWKPLRERSYYKRAKGKRGVRGGPQGDAYARDAKDLDRKAVADRKEEQQAAPAPTQNRKKGGRRR